MKTRVPVIAAILSGMLLLAPVIRAGAATAPAGEPLAKPFQATYQVRRGRLEFARSVFSLHDEGAGTWRYRSVTTPVGLISLFRDDVVTETSRFRIHDDRLRPLSYTFRYQNSSRDRDQSVEFDWRNMMAHTVNEGRKKDISLKPGMTDRFLAQLALSRDLAAGHGPTLTYTVVDRSEIKRYMLKQAESEQLRTPAGRFATIRITKHEPDSGRITTFWCAPALDYLPVKIAQSEPDKPTVNLTLEDFKALAPREIHPAKSDSKRH